jgi:hypothetical protein
VTLLWLAVWAGCSVALIFLAERFGFLSLVGLLLLLCIVSSLS